MSLPLLDRSPAPDPDASQPSADGSGPAGPRKRRRRRTRIAAASAIALAAVAAAAAALAQPGSNPRRSSASAIPPGDTTTTVTRQTLVESARLDGTLGYGGAFEVYDRIAGTFTWLPAVGAVIGRGGTLFRINEEPVALMYGSVPAYRALKAGVSDGPDVAQLNANLIALGFDPHGAISDEDRFGEATTDAVRRWQSSEGLPQTGEVMLGRVVFAPGARRVTALKAVLGEDPPGNSEPPAKSSPAKKSPAKSSPAKKEASKASAASKENSKASKESGPSPAAAPKAVFGTSSTRQIVQLSVKASQQQLAHVGERAPVTLPDGRVVGAHITSVGTVAESSEAEKNGGGGGGGENATISVALALDHPVRRLDKAPVSVELVKSVRRNVLAVPATALVATAGGGYAIEVLEGGRRVPLAVTPGMFANGYVEIQGSGVREGLTVTEPQ